MIPPETLQIWIDFQSNYAPTYPFFSQPSKFPQQATPTKSFKIKSFDVLKDELLKGKGEVCIVGFRGVGKSTIFNALLGKKSRLVETTSLISRPLHPQLTIIDTPAFNVAVSPFHALLGIGNPTLETITDLLLALDKLPPQYYAQLEKLYEIPALVRPIEGNRFIDPTKDLLVHVARKFKRMGKNGPSLAAAARIVGEDCLQGKIQWWIEPRERSIVSK